MSRPCRGAWCQRALQQQSTLLNLTVTFSAMADCGGTAWIRGTFPRWTVRWAQSLRPGQHPVPSPSVDLALHVPVGSCAFSPLRPGLPSTVARGRSPPCVLLKPGLTQDGEEALPLRGRAAESPAWGKEPHFHSSGGGGTSLKSAGAAKERVEGTGWFSRDKGQPFFATQAS